MANSALHIPTLELRAIDQTWQIKYLATQSRQLRLTVSPGGQQVITLFGVLDPKLINKLLEKWLKLQAEQHLVPWLQRLSLQHNLSFNKVTLRGQHTIWGSCTHDRNISLNYKLLFMPPEYAQHIILHELCHLKHLNHSKRFWSLLHKLDPKTTEYDKAIRKADHFVPPLFKKALAAVL